MSRAVLILRPEPGAGATARRAAAMGLEPIGVPLFEIVPRAWTLPDVRFDAVLMTSANAARCGGPQLRAVSHLPLYAVGEATAQAAREAGFAEVRIAGPDLMASFERLHGDGCADVLHLVGEHRTEGDPGVLSVHTEVIYAAEVIEPAPLLGTTLVHGPVVLLHSRRAAQRFVECIATEHVVRSGIHIAAISAAVAEAAGDGWRAKGIAHEPTDDALLEVAARLCD